MVTGKYRGNTPKGEIQGSPGHFFRGVPAIHTGQQIMDTVSMRGKDLLCHRCEGRARLIARLNPFDDSQPKLRSASLQLVWIHGLVVRGGFPSTLYKNQSPPKPAIAQQQVSFSLGPFTTNLYSKRVLTNRKAYLGMSLFGGPFGHHVHQQLNCATSHF